MFRRHSRNHSQFVSFSASTTAYARGNNDPQASTAVAARRMPVLVIREWTCTLILVLQMRTINPKQGTAMIKSHCRSTITNENTKKFVVFSLLKEYSAVRIVGFKVLTVFWQRKVC